jgi:putative FmdB family regulatory protein
MPLYEYQCEECSKRIEIIQKFSDPPLTECLDCGGRLERLLSAPAIQFKGAGWYINDYARKGNGSENGAPAKEEKGTAKPESKPESSTASTSKSTGKESS